PLTPETGVRNPYGAPNKINDTSRRTTAVTGLPRTPLWQRRMLKRRMDCLRLLIAGVLAAGVACTASNALASNILIQIDKPSQTMTVAVDGQVQFRWPVSTGATGFSTPTGSYTPFRMEVMHYSREWDNAGMPHAIFFTKRGHSIHGSDHL